ncbi:MAG TPA: pyrroline-5-carboxylate reductase [Lautropia sp.]|nr:pyrroline-5-carboxylate reductase [Lautropia sp.]
MTDLPDRCPPTAESSTALDGRRILFIGGGNMAGAMIGGLVATGVSPGSIGVIEPTAAARQALVDKHGPVGTFTDAGEIEVDGRFDAVVLAVKPQQAAPALAACRALLARTPQVLILSIAAGIGVDLLISLSGGHRRVIRAMPNTPSLIGHGISGLFAPPDAGPGDLALAQAILSAVGKVVRVPDEGLIDTVTAVSGSGPAYAFYLIEAMTEAGITGGLDLASARTLAIHTVNGAALLALASEEPAEILRARVTSPGGTTAAAVAVLDRREVKASIVEAIGAAAARSRQLSDEAKAAQAQPGGAAGAAGAASPHGTQA